ncbi:copper/zinc superoxide dismutase domain-containing protein [Ceratobasidium sp. AG-Ba]|nr:copper/zinc superoxide dismutase domain-containing protein [Ceratobasidium sp. AG-Ba]
MKAHTHDPSPATPPAISQRAPGSLFKSPKAWAAAAVAVAVLFVGLQMCWSRIAGTHGAPSPAVHAVAVLRGPNSNVTGTVYFSQPSPVGPVFITGELNNLDPDAERGFHIHEFGDLTNGCVSSGSHYNPFGQTHGAPNDVRRHVGDLGNIRSNSDGVAKLDFADSVIKLVGPFSIIGRTVLVHTGTDDLGRGDNDESLKTGNAGQRAACGVVGYRPKPSD